MKSIATSWELIDKSQGDARGTAMATASNSWGYAWYAVGDWSRTLKEMHTKSTTTLQGHSKALDDSWHVQKTILMNLLQSQRSPMQKFKAILVLWIHMPQLFAKSVTTPKQHLTQFIVSPCKHLHFLISLGAISNNYCAPPQKTM